MSAPASGDLAVLQAAFDRAEAARQEAAEAERAAYQRWQDTYAAHEIAGEDASAAWQAWAAGIGR